MTAWISFGLFSMHTLRWVWYFLFEYCLSSFFFHPWEAKGFISTLSLFETWVLFGVWFVWIATVRRLLWTGVCHSRLDWNGLEWMGCWGSHHHKQASPPPKISESNSWRLLDGKVRSRIGHLGNITSTTWVNEHFIGFGFMVGITYLRMDMRR